MPAGKGGGTAIYILKSLTFNVKINQNSLSKHIECLTVEISNKTGKNINISCVYRPPDGNVRSFIKLLKNNIFYPVSNDKNVFIVGDFNIDALNYNKYKNTKTFFDSLLEKNIYPSIHKPTRVTSNSYSIIDNIFSNTLTGTNFEAGIIKNDLTDHFPTFLISKDTCSPNRNTSPKILYKRKLTKANLDSFKNKLINTSWNQVLNINDTNEAYTFFSNIIEKSFNETCPIAEFKVKMKEFNNPWMTNGLKKS